jgi:hypothetical protein
VLARLWKGSLAEARPLPPLAPLYHSPGLRPRAGTLNPFPRPQSSSAGPRRRRKPIEIENIYPEKKPEPEGLVHAGVAHVGMRAGKVHQAKAP